MSLLTRLEHIQPSELGHIAVLYGGTSAERDISLQTGQAVADALARMHIPHTLIDVANDIYEKIREANPDRVFIGLHGRGGEDGSIQGMLQFMGLPYTGSGVLASALALNKNLAKVVWQQYQLPTAPWLILEPETDFAQVIRELGPVMVKPVNEGSSIGMSKAATAAQLKAAFTEAVRFDSQVIAEAWIDGPEYTVPLLCGVPLPVIQMVAEDAFYTYEAKYLSDRTKYLCPAPIAEDMALQMQDLAMRAFNALGCQGWGRVDLMLDPRHGPLLLEANTIPGMTSHSLVPMSAASYGLSFDQLVLLILDTVEVVA